MFQFLSDKKLSRGISRAEENVHLVSRARKEIMDFHTTMQGKNLDNLYFIETPDSTFTLPDLSVYNEDFRCECQ
jgi:OTU domain-containing protein 7